jgi:hypothetical protein
VILGITTFKWSDITYEDNVLFGDAGWFTQDEAGV